MEKLKQGLQTHLSGGTHHHKTLVFILSQYTFSPQHATTFALHGRQQGGTSMPLRYMETWMVRKI